MWRINYMPIPQSPDRLKDLAERIRAYEAHSRCFLGPVLAPLYRLRVLRPFIRVFLYKMEGTALFSRTLREILSKQYGVKVGMYSYGECLKPGVLPRGTRIGNYCSIASELCIHRRNHPTDRISQHPFFYNKRYGLIAQDSIEVDVDNPLVIGHDVWIGTRTIILPNCTKIGDGAIIGAGSVVTRDVEPFSIVGGNPARVIKQRFDPETARTITESQWWLRPLPDLLDCLGSFSVPGDYEAVSQVVRSLAGRFAQPGTPAGESPGAPGGGN